MLRTRCAAIVADLVRQHQEQFEDVDDSQWIDDDLIRDAESYLRNPEDGPGQLSDLLSGIIDKARVARHDELEALFKSAQLAAQDLSAPKSDLDAALREWGDEQRQGALVDAWSAVLSPWRKAHNMTTRQAAVALGISASAVTRYESGSRSPSSPQLRALVEAMIAWDPATDDHSMSNARYVFSELFGENPDEIADLLDERDAERLSLLAQIDEALEGSMLPVDQLRILVSLTTTPGALAHLAALVRSTTSAIEPSRP